MKYGIETTDSGCIEKLEFNGKQYEKIWESKGPGYLSSKSRDFCEQMENDGINDETLLDKVYEEFDEHFLMGILFIAERWGGIA